MRKTREQKAITLIALIITIIVLLILALVTINAVKDGGIINYAQKAKNDYERESENENSTLGGYLSIIESNIPGGNNTITNEVPGDESEEEPEVITNYTAEEIEADAHLYAIGKTVPTYVVAKFNEVYTEVTITKNGEESDGLIKQFASWTGTSPMTTYANTLETAIIEQGVTNTGTGSGPAGGTFFNCTKLKNVTIPNSVTSIGQSAFSGCTGLTSITIANSVTSIGQSAFSDCTGLTSITIPNSVTSIDMGAFYNCIGLTSVTIPSSVTSIGGNAFYNCIGLTSVTIPSGVTSIGGYAFYNCIGLTSVTIPDSVTIIYEFAFSGCTGLTSITIPNSVTSIGRRAFYDCPGLTKVKIMSVSLSFPQPDYVFYNLAPNAKIYVLNDEVKNALKAYYDSTKITVEVVTEERMKEL